MNDTFLDKFGDYIQNYEFTTIISAYSNDMHKLIGEKHYGSIFKDCADKLKEFKKFLMKKVGCTTCPFNKAEAAESDVNKSDHTSKHQSNFVFKKFFIQYEKHE